MPQIALVPRNVFVYDASVNPMVLVAGCHQFGHFTNAEFYFCLGIFFQQPTPDDFRLLADDQTILPNDTTILPPGQYYVISSSIIFSLFAIVLTHAADPAQYKSVVLTQESARPRTISGSTTPSTPRVVARWRCES